MPRLPCPASLIVPLLLAATLPMAAVAGPVAQRVAAKMEEVNKPIAKIIFNQD